MERLNQGSGCIRANRYGIDEIWLSNITVLAIPVTGDLSQAMQLKSANFPGFLMDFAFVAQPEVQHEEPLCLLRPNICSEVKMDEVLNAVDNANRELATRFDFRGVEASFELNKEEVKLEADADFQLKQMVESCAQPCSSATSRTARWTWVTAFTPASVST